MGWRRSDEEAPIDPQGGAAGAVPTSSVAIPVGTGEPVVGSGPENEFDLAGDLIRRVAGAIDDWADHNGLAGLPPRLIFEQVVGIMNGVYEAGQDHHVP